MIPHPRLLIMQPHLILIDKMHLSFIMLCIGMMSYVVRPCPVQLRRAGKFQNARSYEVKVDVLRKRKVRAIMHDTNRSLTSNNNIDKQIYKTRVHDPAIEGYKEDNHPEDGLQVHLCIVAYCTTWDNLFHFCFEFVVLLAIEVVHWLVVSNNTDKHALGWTCFCHS